MVKRGFDRTATKDDIRNMATKDDIHDVKDDIRLLHDRINTLEDDVHDIKVAMGPVVRVVAALDSDVKGLNLRVLRLERKVGLTRS